MRRIKLLFIIVTTCATLANAQRKEAEKTNQINEYSNHDAYFSIGTGINSGTGIVGLGFEKLFTQKTSAYLCAGIGTWGNKITIGGRYYTNPTQSSAFSFSYSYVTGASERKLDLNVVDSTSSGQGTLRTVAYVANPVSVINLSWSRFWKIGKRTRFNIELGYSFSLQSNYESNYSIKPLGVTLTETSQSVMRSYQPGGVILGLGFGFGL